MTSAVPLMVELRREGVEFRMVGERLKVIVPKGVTLSEATRARLGAHRADIVRRLRCGGIDVQDVLAVFPGATVVCESSDLGTCGHCAGSEWWINLFGMASCGRCFPPTTLNAVATWIRPRREEAA